MVMSFDYQKLGYFFTNWVLRWSGIKLLDFWSAYFTSKAPFGRLTSGVGYMCLNVYSYTCARQDTPILCKKYS